MTGELLKLLGDGDAGRAEAKYNELFRYFCRFFEYRGCENPEDLAQTVFVRGIERVRGGSTVYASGFGGFLFGIARMMLKEERKRRRTIPLDGIERVSPHPPGLNPIETGILTEQCLNHLEPDERTALIEYLKGKRSRPGESAQALRIRIFRIRRKLDKFAANRKNAAAAG